MARHNIFRLCLSLQKQNWISVIRVGMASITASLCVQCLGVCIDRHLDLKKQVSQTISACSFYLRNINHISCFLPRPTKERVVNAIITSRLDYYNALLYGTSAVNIARLQRIHKTAARLIMRSPRSDSATPFLRELHWLPIVCRVDFKLLVFTYKAMHNDAPVYLCELVCPYQPKRTLRSANNNKLELKRTRTKAIYQRSLRLVTISPASNVYWRHIFCRIAY